MISFPRNGRKAKVEVQRSKSAKKRETIENCMLASLEYSKTAFEGLLNECERRLDAEY